MEIVFVVFAANIKDELEAEMDRSKKESANDDFRMRYQVCIQDIENFKQKQMSITYYILSLFAAIIVFYSYCIKETNHFNSSIQTQKLEMYLFLASILLLAIGTFFQYVFQERLHEFMSTRNYIVEHLSHDFMRYEIVETKIANGILYKDWLVFYACIIILFMGWCAVYVFIYGIENIIRLVIIGVISEIVFLKAIFLFDLQWRYNNTCYDEDEDICKKKLKKRDRKIEKYEEGEEMEGEE